MKVKIPKKPDFKNIRIRTKIYIYILIFLIVLLCALWFVQVVFFNSLYKQVKKQEAVQVTNTVKKVLNKEKTVEQLILEADEREVCIIVFDSFLQTAYSLDGPRECIIHKMSSSEIVSIIELLSPENESQFLEYMQEDATYRLVTNNLSSDFRLFRENKGTNHLVYVTKVEDISGEEYIVLINSQGMPLTTVINASRMVLLVVSAITLIVATILSFIMSKSISDPIENISKSAQKLAKGNYNVNFNADGYKEIQELSDTLNYTAVELSKLEHLRQEFIANMSHDLRTPLTLIAGYAEVMRDIPGENSPENAQVIINEAKRLSSMVNDVMNIAQIQSGNTKPNKQIYNFTDSINLIVENMSELLKNKGYEIKFYYDEKVFVNADKTLINQSFYNLLVNAVNYSKDKKKIEVIQTVKDKTVKIEVKDRGKGVPKDIIPYIWERYYKSERSTSTGIKNYGLGLSMVKTFITAHNGTCGVESTEGQGSTFWFEIEIIKNDNC